MCAHAQIPSTQFNQTNENIIIPWFVEPKVERYMRDNNRQTIGKLGFAGFGKKWIMQSWVCRSKVQEYSRNEET